MLSSFAIVPLEIPMQRVSFLLGFIHNRHRLQFAGAIADFEGGKEPAAALKGELYKVRAIAVSLEDNGTPFYEGAKEHLHVR